MSDLVIQQECDITGLFRAAERRIGRQLDFDMLGNTQPLKQSLQFGYRMRQQPEQSKHNTPLLVVVTNRWQCAHSVQQIASEALLGKLFEQAMHVGFLALIGWRKTQPLINSLAKLPGLRQQNFGKAEPLVHSTGLRRRQGSESA